MIVSGTLGDHGMAIMAQRENLAFDSEIRSDTAALHGLAAVAIAAAPGLRCSARPDPRGGWRRPSTRSPSQSGVGIVLDEAAIPVDPQVAAACEFLGLDPRNIANEGEADRRVSGR